MRELQDSIHIGAAPEKVWAWLITLSEHYGEWHPGHVSAEWERGRANALGSVLKIVEYIGGHREVLRFEVTDVHPLRRVAYRIRGAHGVLLPGGAFEVSPDEDGSTFRATIQYRFGSLTERAFGPRIAALRAHMREEGENLKRLLES